MNKLYSFVALDKHVLVAYVSRVDGWCAYIGAVAGSSHKDEVKEVMERGTKLTRDVAMAINPAVGEELSRHGLYVC